MSEIDYIYHSDLEDIVNSLKTVYENHSLAFPSEVDSSKDEIYATSEEIIAIYNAFQQVYENEKFSAAEKWTVDGEELQKGGQLKKASINNALVSLASLETINPCTRTEHLNVVTYTQTTHTATTTYSDVTYSSETWNCSRTSNTAGTSYSQTSCGKSCVQNSMRNQSYSGNNQCTCHVVYSSDCSQTSNTAATTYSESTHKAGTSYGYSSYTAGTTYTKTDYTAGTNYTEEI